MCKTKLLSYLLLVIVACSLSACWDQRPIEDLGLINCVGIDIYPENPELLDFTFVYPLFLEERRQAAKLDIIAAANIGEAINIWERRNPRRFAAGKVGIVIFGTEAAQQDLSGLFDYAQLPLFDDNAYVAVAAGKASDLLQTPLPETEIIATHLHTMFRTNRHEGQTILVTVGKLMTLATVQGIDPILPKVHKLGEDRIELDGAVLFQDRRMVGTLDQNELLIFMALQGQHSIVSIAPTTANTGELAKPKVELDLVSPKTKIRPQLQDGKLVVNFSLQASYVLHSYSSVQNITKPEAAQSLTRDLESYLLIEAERLITKLQELGVDPLGVGKRLRASNFRQFDPLQFREQWADAAISIDVKLTPFRAGAIDTTQPDR